MFAKVLDSGVKASVCVVCSDDYGVTEQLRVLGVVSLFIRVNF